MGLQWHWLETVAVAEAVVQVVLTEVAQSMMSRRSLVLGVANNALTRLACDIRTASRLRPVPATICLWHLVTEGL